MLPKHGDYHYQNSRQNFAVPMINDLWVLVAERSCALPRKFGCASFTLPKYWTRFGFEGLLGAASFVRESNPLYPMPFHKPTPNWLMVRAAPLALVPEQDTAVGNSIGVLPTVSGLFRSLRAR